MRKLLSATCALAMVVPATVLTATSAEARSYYSGCKRGKNTVGIIIGGAAGALLGREVQRGRRCR